MKYTLWIIYDALKEYEPQMQLKDSFEPPIENIRLHSIDKKRMSDTLYVERSNTFFNDGDDHVICIHGNNYIYLNTRNLNSVFNTLIVFWESTHAWHNEIAYMISQNCMLKDVLSKFKDRIPFPLMILDSSQVALAISEDYGLGTIDDKWDNMIKTGSFGVDILRNYNSKHKNMMLTRDFYRIPADPFPYESYNHNLFINNEFMGFFSLIINGGTLTESHKAWFAIATDFVSNWISMYAGQNDLLIKNACFHELLDGRYENLDRFNAALITQGWNTDANKTIVVLSCVSNILNMNNHIIKILSQKSQYLFATEFMNQIVIMLNSDMLPDMDFFSLACPIAESTGYYGGMSNTFSNLRDLPHYLMQARLPIKYGPPPVGRIAACQEHMIPYIMEVLSENVKMNISHPALNILKKYDSDHNSSYYRLLYTYLTNQCNQSQTAAKLNMHRSSLIRKINHIYEISNIDLDDYNTRLHLTLSYEFEAL